MTGKNNNLLKSIKQGTRVETFGIKKFKAGAASVLIGASIFFGAGVASAADQDAQSNDNKTELAADDESDSAKAQTETTSTQEAPAAVAKEEAKELNKADLEKLINDVKNNLENGIYDNKTEESLSKLNELMLNAEVVVKDATTQEAIDKAQKELQDFVITGLVDKKAEVKEEAKSEDKAENKEEAKSEDKVETKEEVKSEEKAENKEEAKSEEKVDSKEETKSEEATSTKEETTVAEEKTALDQLVSEAQVLSDRATNYVAKATDSTAAQAVTQSVSVVKEEVTKALDVIKNDEATKDDVTKKSAELRSAIEAVATNLRRAGLENIDAVLADEATTTTGLVPPKQLVTVASLTNITDEEVEAIIKEIRSANPSLTEADKITVTRTGQTNLGGATITFADGRPSVTFNSTQTILGSAGTKNLTQLQNSINWFDFSAATIIYADGTKSGPARELSTPVEVDTTNPKTGAAIKGRITKVRDITYADGSKGLSTDEKFLKSGIAKYSVHVYYNGTYQNNREMYEVVQEGMRFQVPTRVNGYELEARVTKLAPKQVATNPNPNKEQNALRVNNDAGVTDVNNVKPVDIILTTQDTQWSYLKIAGLPLNDAQGKPALSAFTANVDGSNAGISFALSATYKGRPVDVNLIAADGEESGHAELIQFETDGSNWQELMSLNLAQYGNNGVVPTSAGNLDWWNGKSGDASKGTWSEDGYNTNEWVNKDENGNVVAYGTKLFGPFETAMRYGNALPIGFTQGVNNLSMYMNSRGAQAGVIGFIVFDGGDAPQSYGSAQHIIGNFNTEKNGEQVTATQPFLGDQPADPDFKSTATEPSGAWTLDDLTYTDTDREVALTSGTSQVTNQAGDTGTFTILPNGNPVIVKADGTQVAIANGSVLSTTETITATDTNTNTTTTGLAPVRGVYNNAKQNLFVGDLPDEGEGQLLDAKVAKTYSLRQATDTEYVLEGVKMNRGVNNDVAYVYGWVDFDGNGKFDKYERSELITVNEDGTYTVSFKNTPQLLNTSIDKVGVRLRIALSEKEIMDSTGIASSGEVEDFQVAVVHPPRGTKQTTSDFQDREQSITVKTNELFNASGKTKASDFNAWNQVNEDVAPKIVVTSSVVASEEATGNNIHIQDSLGNTIYRGDEVVIKDAKGNTLGTAVKVTNPLNGTTEYYLSEYNEYDTAGNKVGTYTLNKGREENKNVVGEGGVYNTTINFKPEAPYVGTAKGIAIRAWDNNNNSTGWNANDLTIEKSLASETLADKDKIRENINNNNNGRISMDSVYIPTVIDVKPVGNNEATTDAQGKAQSAKPVIPTYGTVQTVTDGRVEDVRYDSRYVILDPTKPATLSNNRENPAKAFATDTVVTEETTVTLPNGQDATFKPADTIANNTQINANAITITGSGNVTLNGIRYGRGSVVPAGASITGAVFAVQSDVEVIRNGQQVTLHAGDRFQTGDTLVNDYTTEDSTTWRKTFQTGETIPAATANRYAATVGEVTTDQLVANGQSVTIGNASGTTTYTVNNIVPAGSTQAPTYTPLTDVTLPNAVHLDPVTGAITVVPRKYTEVTDTKIVIENEGTYELNQQTGEVTFTPDPKFIGVGTGVDLQQPDVDYSTPVEGDPVTAKYGTDYGRARYTPTVTPKVDASITRTIKYVYENGDAILSVDNKPVTATQTIDYTRTYSVYGSQSSVPQTVAGHDVTDVNGKVYTAGTIIPAGTVVPAGTVIISAWTPAGSTTQFDSVISPTVEGYTAEVQTPSPEYVKNTAGTGLARVVDGKGVGAYTPVTNNTEDVGTYQVNPLAVTSDDTDNFEMVVVYKADTQKARVIYIDLDDNNKVLEIQTGEAAPTTGAAANTTYGVTGLSGKSDTDMTYSTADTIKSYTDRGFELAADGYSTDANGNKVERKFDTDSNVDQEYRVYLRHQKQTRQIKDTQEVKRTIEYKYANTDDVSSDLRGATAAPTETETLKFERDRIIDLAKAAELYPEQYKTYKAVLDKEGKAPDGDTNHAEYKARVVYYDHITNQAKAADATEAQKSAVSFGQWTALTSEKTVGTETKEGKAADKQFDQVTSPDIAGYVPNNAVVEATGDIDPEATDYTVTVTYTPAEQKLTINFSEVDANGNVITPGVASPIVKGGKSGADFPADTAAEVTAKIAELTNKGYELVSNGYAETADKKFDTDASVDQVRTVTVRATTKTINPNDPNTPQNPQPGQPVDPNNPDGPKWPESVKDLKTKDTVKRTINYIYADGSAVGEQAPTKVEETNFTRTATINLVTGEITYGNWSAAQTFEAVTSPTIENYTASQATIAAETVAAEASDIVHTVIYNANKIPVDPTQPTTPGGETPKPEDKVPNDPKGRTYKDLGVFEDVTRTINYIYADGSEAKPTVTETKTFTRTATIDAITGEATYGDWSANQTFAEVATPAIDNYTPTKDSVAASTVSATASDIYETVIYNATTVDVDPNKPADPTKPADPETNPTPKPEDKVPNDPKGRTYADLGLIETVTHTVNYKLADGSDAGVPAKSETLTFTRTAKINAVTGDITEYGEWTARNNDTTFDAVNTPVKEGYVASAKASTEIKDVKATDNDSTETIIYSKLGSYVPVVPEGITPPPGTNVTPTPYPTPNQPTDPTQPVGPNNPIDPTTPGTPTTTPVVPHIPGTTPVGPDGKPLEPVTPGKPEDGYKVPPVPTDPTQNTTITYVKDGSQVAVTHFVEVNSATDRTEKGGVAESVVDTGDTGKAFNQTAIDKVASTIADLQAKGYTLVENGFKATDTFDTDASTNQEYKVLVTVNNITVNPNDPTNPTPTPKPGDPIDPNNPTGPKWTEDLIKEITENTKDTVKRTINYVYADGTAVGEKAPTKVEEVSFSRTATINPATGQISYGAWSAAQEFAAVISPTIENYTASQATVAAETVAAEANDIVHTVIYNTTKAPVDPTQPTTPGGETPKPEDKVPNDPKGRTYGDLGLIKDVTRTINYVYADGSEAKPSVTESKRFTRTATIDVVTGEVTYGDWSAAQNFDAVTSPTIENYTPTKASVAASSVTADSNNIVETVIYNSTSTTVDPNKPVDPTKPTDPDTNPLPKPEDKVPNDPKGRTYADLGLIETVTHTVNYKLADGSDAGVPSHVETLTFTRTAKIDSVTGAVSDYSAWTARDNDTTFDAVATPVKAGYVASAKASTEIKDVKATDNDSAETIIYSKLGSYVPVVPDGVTPPPGTNVTPTPYPDPTPQDPTKPGTPTTTPVVPHIPGTTPVGPDGKPLEPVTPGKPEDGYKVPPVPTDPTQNTTITYVKDGSQVAVVHFVDEDGNAVHTSVVEAGETGTSFTKAGEVASIISELEARGYAVVANKAGQAEYPAENARIFDALDDKGTNGPSQVYYVTVGAKTIPVDPTKPTDPTNPENPKPGDPIDPNNPTGPKWTEDLLNKLNNIKSVNRTITYVKEDGSEVDTTNAPKVTDKVTFTRVAIVKASDGSLLGYDTNGDGAVDVPATDTTSGWTAVNNDTTFDAVKSPVVKGYILKDATQATIAETTNLTQDSADENIKVVYVPVGSIVPKVPSGETPDTPATPTPYPNDPQDPGKVVTPDPEKPTDPNDPTSPTTPVAPHVPGHTPKDPDGNPLKPVDPENPSKGYIPPVPKDPTKDTEITYDKDDQKAVVRYVVQGGAELVNLRASLSGKSGEKIDYSTADTIKTLQVLGYELVSDDFTAGGDKNFDKDSSVDQEFIVIVTPKVVPVDPTKPTDPTNPENPKPGDPIDPNNPTGPKWTEDQLNKLDNIRTVNRTITYVDEEGNTVATTVSDKVTFTRITKVNVVTGRVVEYGEWTAVNNDTTFDAVKSPIVKGYVLKDASKATIDATENLTQDSVDENIEVVYVKVGSIVPKVPSGETPDTPATPTPYPNDPQDPGKVVTPDPEKPTDPNDPTSPTTPVVPHVPGHTPKDPDGNPLKPVDPENPSKGYIPPVPKDPTKDTEITYDKDDQKAIIKYVDQSTGSELSHDEVSGKTGEQINYSTEDKIKELIKQGYVVVTDEFTNNGPKSYDNVTDKDGQDPSQVFVVTVTPKIVPVTPIVPTDPNEPVNPNKPNPGDPIDPENPEGPKWTDELINKLDNVKEVTRTITYVDEQNNSVATTVTDKVTFTREARVNVVTGEITYGNWVARNNDTTFDAVKSPVVKGYILRDATQATVAETTGLTQDSADENIKVVYVKLGSWIPQIPGQPTDPIVYPNDPTDPTKPGTDKPVVPYVPGHTPVDPNGNPLKPVDPKDPSKGYEVPDVPQDPTKDTIIKYVKDPQPRPEPQPQPEPQPRPEPQPEPEKPVTPTLTVNPVQPEQPAKVEKVDKQLPHTDATNNNAAGTATGVAMVGLIGAAVAARRKNK